MTDSAEGRRATSGLRRISAERRIPAHSRRFATRLSGLILGVLLLSLVALGVAGLLDALHRMRHEADRVAAARLDALGAVLREGMSRRVAFARSLAADRAVRDAARKFRLGWDETGNPVILTSAERATLEARLAPTHLLEPEGEASRRLRERLPAFPGVTAAFFTEASGVAVGGSGPTPASVKSAEGWWKGAMKKGVDVSLPAPGNGIPLDAFCVSVTIDDPERAGKRGRLGVLALHMSYF